MDIVSIIIQALLGLMFVMAGIMKVAGVKMHVDNFAQWGLPQWFRVVTGLVELIAAALLIVGIWKDSWAALGGLLLAVTMLGGVLVHVRAKEPFKASVPAAVMCIASVIVLLLNAGSLGDWPQ